MSAFLAAMQRVAEARSLLQERRARFQYGCIGLTTDVHQTSVNDCIEPTLPIFCLAANVGYPYLAEGLLANIGLQQQASRRILSCLNVAGVTVNKRKAHAALNQNHDLLRNLGRVGQTG